MRRLLSRALDCVADLLNDYGLTIVIVLFLVFVAVALHEQSAVEARCVASKCRTGKPVMLTDQCICAELPEPPP